MKVKIKDGNQDRFHVTEFDVGDVLEDSEFFAVRVHGGAVVITKGSDDVAVWTDQEMEDDPKTWRMFRRPDLEANLELRCTTK